MGRLGTTPATAAWLLPYIKLPYLVASSAYLSLWIIDPQVPFVRVRIAYCISFI